MKKPRTSSPAEHKVHASGTLEAAAAAAIYAMRPPRSAVNFEFDASAGPKPTDVAKTFGVSSKVVRDIWNRKTWAYATRHLWCPLEIAASIAEESGILGDIPIAKVRRRGRPAGAKDSVPRRKKSTSGASDEESAAPTPAASPSPKSHNNMRTQQTPAAAPVMVQAQQQQQQQQQQQEPMCMAPVMPEIEIPAVHQYLHHTVTPLEELRGNPDFACSQTWSSDEDFEVHEFSPSPSIEDEMEMHTYSAFPQMEAYSFIHRGEQDEEWMRKLELINGLEDDNRWMCV